MKKEDKELLIKDLCARLPYNTMIHGIYTYANPDYNYGKEPDKILHSENDSVLTSSDIEWIEMDAAEIKPYLFPMSSMTEEQKKQLKVNCDWYDNEENVQSILVLYQEHFIMKFNVIDWLNKNYFDYRGLIKKGLAIDATNLNIY